jgi:hypothetical protein
VLAYATSLTNLGPCVAMVTAAALLMCLLAHGLRGRTCKASWLACGLSTFAMLFLALHVLLPGYYRKFSIRSELRSLAAHVDKTDVPLVCYPHSWDSARFYLGCPDVHTYSPVEKRLLFAHLHARPSTLLLVKSGHVLDDLLRALPGSLKFVPVGRPGSIAVAGLIRSETEAPHGAKENSQGRTPLVARYEQAPEWVAEALTQRWRRANGTVKWQNDSLARVNEQ